MENDVRFCPMTYHFEGVANCNYCVKQKCAWWVAVDEMCAVAAIADFARGINGELTDGLYITVRR